MLPEEQAFALTDDNSPAYIAGFYQVLAGLSKDQEKIIDAFRTGKGLGWETIIITVSKVQRDPTNLAMCKPNNKLDSFARRC